jgi:hypothetical protein
MTDPAAPSLAVLQSLTNAQYAFYRDQSHQRADDLYVRNRAADAVCRAASRLDAAITAARRAIPPATRENPYPDPVLVAKINELRATQSRLNALETRLRGPAALPDRDFSQLRASTAHCDKLVQHDAFLLEAAEAPDLEHHIARLETAIDARAALATEVQTA